MAAETKPAEAGLPSEGDGAAVLETVAPGDPAGLTSTAPAPAAAVATSAPQQQTSAPPGDASADAPAKSKNGSDEAGSKAEPDWISPEMLQPPEPAACFERARQAVKRLHEVLDALEAVKASGKEQEELAMHAKAMQMELLALRAAHRVMSKATDAGRTGEAAARKVVDTTHIYLETRRFASSACRVAGERNKALLGPEFHPELTVLLPYLDGKYDLNVDADSDGELPSLMEAERQERSSLEEQLHKMEAVRARDSEALQNQERHSNELLEKLASVEKAMEPVSNLLELRPRQAGSSVSAEALAELPAPLRLIFSKFDTLSAFGSSSGVSVRIEDPHGADSAPPAKRQKVSSENGSRTASVCVESKGVTLRFSLVAGSSSSKPTVVVVVAEGCGDTILGSLWPEDDGKSGPLFSSIDTSSAKKTGLPYLWAQVLGGLRDQLLILDRSSLPEAVSAAEVLQRVRAKLSS